MILIMIVVTVMHITVSNTTGLAALDGMGGRIMGHEDCRRNHAGVLPPAQTRNPSSPSIP